ncbi:MAG: hypothetical protein PHF00_07655 [Elusimicrobia bacterium]|nr:hypothetical protein [Elusimicrobiota bacterium]
MIRKSILSLLSACLWAAGPSFAAGPDFDGKLRDAVASPSLPAMAPTPTGAMLTLFTIDGMRQVRMPAPKLGVLSAQNVTAFTDPVTNLTYTFDDDVPADIQKQMRDDLAFIGGLKGNGASGLHKEIFGQVDGPTYARFFETRVTAIGMSECGGGNAVACVMPFFNSSKMWLTQNFIKFSHPQIARLMIVFHESRHTEDANGNWSHARCPKPFLGKDGQEIKSIWTGAALAGEPACDKTPLGSYGSSMIMLKNVQKFCASCTEKVRMDAGLYADDQFKRIIDAKARQEMLKDLY